MNEQQTSSVTRRDFLKTSAAATAAATATVAPLGALDISRYAHAAGNDIIKLGIIGCGGRASGAASQVLTTDKGVRLVAMGDILMDRVQSKRAALKKQFGDQVTVADDHCFAGFDAYKQVIAASDAVVIANAAKFHPIHSLTALQAGKHVFVEKPHGIDPAGMKVMQAAADLAKEKKLCLVSGLHSRYHPGYQETVKRIHDGAIGDIVSIEENFLRAPYVVVPRNPGLNELQWQASTQYHFTWMSGDDVIQSLVHNLDRASWCMKEAVPIKCHGMGGRSSMTDPIYGDVFDHHAVVYEFPNNVRLYAFCRTTTGCYDEYSSLIYGTKGCADLMRCTIKGETNWHGNAKADAHYLEQVEYMKAIRAGTPINNGDYMVRSTMIGVMGQISCYTGNEITWEQINKSDFYFPPKAEDCHDNMEPPTKPGPNGSYPTYVPGKTKLI